MLFPFFRKICKFIFTFLGYFEILSYLLFKFSYKYIEKSFFLNILDGF